MLRLSPSSDPDQDIAVPYRLNAPALGAVRTPGTTRKLFALSISIALAMSGVGIILPVVPPTSSAWGSPTLRARKWRCTSACSAAGYALMQLLVAPLWGRLSDSLGRRPLLAIGLIGFAVGQALCGLATSLLFCT